jgi:UDP-N-acetylglucosamine diphosphorylase/glucosamine-1-phosphate N-acetyltransferase
MDIVHRPWDIFLLNGQEIRNDYARITANRTSYPIGDKHTIVYGSDIFIEEGVKIRAAILNAEDGPIYIGKDASIGEGSLIKGPFALCEHGQLSMGATLRGDTTVGPYSKVGGEVSNSVIQGYSSKGHDGFLGNSVIGEWCNLGAGTNNSNLKNNYLEVKMWDYSSESFSPSGRQFCGLIMGDHSKCGISSTFNTGTTVGVSANLFGSGLPRTFIPDFSWGGATGFDTYKLDKMFQTTELVMQRRNQRLTEADQRILEHVFNITRKFRTWDS